MDTFRACAYKIFRFFLPHLHVRKKAGASGRGGDAISLAGTRNPRPPCLWGCAASDDPLDGTTGRHPPEKTGYPPRGGLINRYFWPLVRHSLHKIKILQSTGCSPLPTT